MKQTAGNGRNFVVRSPDTGSMLTALANWSRLPRVKKKHSPFQKKKKNSTTKSDRLCKNTQKKKLAKRNHVQTSTLSDWESRAKIEGPQPHHTRLSTVSIQATSEWRSASPTCSSHRCRFSKHQPLAKSDQRKEIPSFKIWYKILGDKRRMAKRANKQQVHDLMSQKKTHAVLGQSLDNNLVSLRVWTVKRLHFREGACSGAQIEKQQRHSSANHKTVSLIMHTWSWSVPQIE